MALNNSQRSILDLIEQHSISRVNLSFMREMDWLYTVVIVSDIGRTMHKYALNINVLYIYILHINYTRLYIFY